MKGATGNDDSLHVGIDGSPVSLGGMGVTITSSQVGNWAWTDRKSASATRLTVNVGSAGVHTFNLWMREDGTMVDYFILTRDAAFIPT